MSAKLSNLVPKTGRDWVLLAAGALLATLIMVIAGTRYALHVDGAQGIAFRFDRWTGAVAFCGGEHCVPLKEDPHF